MLLLHFQKSIIIQKGIIIILHTNILKNYTKKITSKKYMYSNENILSVKTRSHVGKYFGNEATSHHSYIDSGSSFAIASLSSCNQELTAV